MNVLILTGKFGMGHVSVAEAIRQETLMDDEDINVTVLDFVEYITPNMADSIYRSFAFFVKHSSDLYNKVNLLADRHTMVPFKSMIEKRIKEMIDEYQPDIIVTTFPSCGKYIGHYKADYHDDIQLYTYITDITLHDEWVASNTDLYFVGGDSTKEALVQRGVLAEDIKVVGIPVKQAFKQATQTIAPPENATQKQILLMGGGLGLIRGIDELIAELLQNPNVALTVIAGNNHELYEKLSTEYPNVRCVGYTTKVNEYMRQADMIITKPGGITMFEAINCETPLLILPPFLLQEIGNARFIEDEKIGVVAWEDDQIVPQAQQLINDDQFLTEIKAKMAHLKAQHYDVSPVTAFRKEEEQRCQNI
ncbi:MGDG synthase family glycosyltransferase [Ligilactobacillus ceti]|nr:glycosyltransferase [Ligilactobacillus ceti]